MRSLRSLLSLAVLGVAMLAAQAVQAVTLDSVLTAGSWKETNELCGDVRCVVQSTKLTATTSTSAVLELPGNALGTIKLQVEGQTLNAGGISPSYTLAPLPAEFPVGGLSGVYTDNVSRTFSLADVTSAAASTSATIDVGQRQLSVAAANVSTSEVLQLRVIYQQPGRSRLRNGTAY